MSETIDNPARTIVAFLPGRMWGMSPNGSNKKPLRHLVEHGTKEGDLLPVAACGAKPGRRSYGWCLQPGYEPTCPKCIHVVANV